MMQLFACNITVSGLTAFHPVATPRVWRHTWKWATSLRPRRALAWSPLLLCLITAAAYAQQQTSELRISSSLLPDAPLPQSDSQSSTEQTPSTEGSAAVSGVVLDGSGAVVPGAQVSLTHRDGTQLRSLVSGAHGEFDFTRLPADSYLVIVNSKGFAPFVSPEFAVSAQQSYEVPSISLLVASQDTEVTVRPTEVIAAEQIKAEEKQRLFGIAPNFYVSYVKDAAPLTTKQKFSLATHDTLDWTSWIGISVSAGIEQANNSYAGYGQGAAGYGKRWAARFGDGRTSDYLSHAVFASLFHQDPRYFYQGTGTKKSRLYHAVSNAWIARSDSGKNMPNYSYLLGTMVSGALSNAYYPHADRGANLVFTNAFIGIAGRAGANVVQEFLGKRLTKNSSASANANP
jgi:Carboxypeptidase regulatory-like domain